MSAPLAPASLAELAEAVRSCPPASAVGAGTKPRLSAVDVPKLSTLRLRGIIEYDPSEFTFTALAGTPVRDIAAALAERGQYLPFDPVLARCRRDARRHRGGRVERAGTLPLRRPARFHPRVCASWMARAACCAWAAKW